MISSKSIHSNLIYHYSAAFITIFALLSLVFYLETTNVINQNDYDFVVNQANNIQYILAEKNIDMNLLRQSVYHTSLDDKKSFSRYFVRVIDDRDHVLIETPGIPKVKLIKDKGYSWHTDKGANYLVIQAPAKISHHSRPGWIQVMLDTSYQKSQMHQRRVYFLILFVATIASILIVTFISRRSLKSINKLSAVFSNMTTNSLHERIQINQLPKELVSLGNAFNDMLNRMENSFKRLTQISADMSHELRTPITNLISQTELLLSYDHSKEEAKQAQLSNLEELQRMSSMIENILFLSRSESSNFQLDKKQLDVLSEVNLVVEYYDAFLDEKSIHIDVSGAASINANPDMFRRMLNNLLSNAIKYTLNNGNISVIIEDQPHQVSITIKDSGVGIPAQHLPRIFDRFYRVDSARSMLVGGSGLGLSIVKSIVELHHASIHVMSTECEGTSFIVNLPK